MDEKICGTCEHRDADKNGAICGKCTANANYSCHWKEHPAVTAYKALKEEEPAAATTDSCRSY